MNNSFSDSDSSERNVDSKSLPQKRDVTNLDDLNLSPEVQDTLQYLQKYIPQQLSLDSLFKSFIPDFLPAVGDIDAFLKTIPPTPNGPNESQLVRSDQSQLMSLGLAVLDEPSANQSDPPLLQLQLRAQTSSFVQNSTLVVKKILNQDHSKFEKTIDKWIKDIGDLHKAKTFPLVKYTDSMPEVDELLQEWPTAVDNLLRIHGFPAPIEDVQMSLRQYIDIVTSVFDIPIYRNRIQSLYIFFSLYETIKNFQMKFVDTQTSHNENKDFKNSKAETIVME